MNKKLFGALIGIIVVLTVATSWLAVSYMQVKADPQKVAAAETQKLVNQVGALILLPTGETPTVATVVDPEQLKNQPFFANAVKGDKLLIYTNSKKAILYDPAQNKIIEVAPINIGSQASAGTSQTTTAATSK
jgi:hypothetical protein